MFKTHFHTTNQVFR